MRPRDPRPRERRAAGLCVCCGSMDRDLEAIACGCRFCYLCRERGHNNHDGPYAVSCPLAEESA